MINSSAIIYYYCTCVNYYRESAWPWYLRRSTSILLFYKYKKQLQKIERKVGMEYQKEYKQG